VWKRGSVVRCAAVRTSRREAVAKWSSAAQRSQRVEMQWHCLQARDRRARGQVYQGGAPK
jgi:hypothetical protein